MKIIKCLFCSNPTKVDRINIKKKINGKIVTLTNAPVFYCANCKETFISKEAQDVLIEIREKRLDEKKILFNFDEMAKAK
ncbi:YgiT-type zinc finger protein [Acetivibrio cellulolyticus]|uniref:YgiT-type zinc finger protein n=1 Tax=Acetivibrio cellulolyticus TaxID=35830 RepID=UPI0001E2BDDA|nr:YgiT-type zinc finger protein [Acetivibrio cellulolyticus]